MWYMIHYEIMMVAVLYSINDENKTCSHKSSAHLAFPHSLQRPLTSHTTITKDQINWELKDLRNKVEGARGPQEIS